MECYIYLGSKITVVIETKVKLRIDDVRKVLGRMNKVFSCRAIRMNVKRKFYEGVTVPTALYGLKQGVWQ